MEENFSAQYLAALASAKSDQEQFEKRSINDATQKYVQMYTKAVKDLFVVNPKKITLKLSKPVYTKALDIVLGELVSKGFAVYILQAPDPECGEWSNSCHLFDGSCSTQKLSYDLTYGIEIYSP